MLDRLAARLLLLVAGVAALTACGASATPGSQSPGSSPETPAAATPPVRDGPRGSAVSTPGGSTEDPAAKAPAPGAAAASPVATEPVQEDLAFSTGGTGKLPATTIRKVLRDKMPAYIACYQKARERTPDLHGRVAAFLRISPSGAVGEVEMRPDRDARLSSCLADEIKALKFPKPKGGSIDVVYPLDFAGD